MPESRANLSEASIAAHLPSRFSADDFPEEAYFAAFPDVKRAVGAGEFASAFAHWHDFGRAEIAQGVRPDPFLELPATSMRSGPASTTLGGETADFCEALYLAVNPDVADAVAQGQIASGTAHWMAFGRDEEVRGVRPTISQDRFYEYVRPDQPSDLIAETRDFDAEGYLYLYPDVREGVGGDLDAARQHWIRHGRFEHRLGPGVAPYRNWRVNLLEVMAKPFGLNIFGPFGATSGLGTAARNVVRAVEASGLPFALHPYDVAYGPARISRAELDHKPLYRINLILANADQINQFTAQYRQGHFDDAYNISIWAWELAAFRPDWFACFGPVDEVWTNSSFEVEAISAISPVPVHKIRLPIQVEPAPKKSAREAFGIPEDKFVFLTAFDVGSTSARKNPRMVVEAFREAFDARDDAFLVIKFHSSSIEPQITRDLNKLLRGANNTLVIADRLPDRQMRMLQSACDCLVSAHRSEGFGLNIAEFMALGKPVIATAYSGNMEFFDETTGYPIDYRLIEIEANAGPYMPGYVWADPQKDSLVEQFRLVHGDRQEALVRGARAKARMAAEYSSARIGQDIAERLRTIGLDGEIPPFIGWIGRSREIATPPLIRSLSAYSRAALTEIGHKPILSIVVPVYNVPAHYLHACVESVKAQTYPFWELCLADDCSTNAGTVAYLDGLRGTDPRIRMRRLPHNLGISGASNAAAEFATGEFLVMLDNDDLLHPDALLEVARAVDRDKSIDCLYTDEDKIDENSRLIDHYYKPDWSPEHLESVMYVLHMLTIRKKLFLELGGFRDDYTGAQDYDLMLRVSRSTQNIHHIPKVLYHWRAIPGSAATVVDAKPWALDAGERALGEHVEIKFGGAASVEKGLLPGTFRVRRQILGTPRASLVVLTSLPVKDIPERGRISIAENFVNSILARTAYQNYEIVLVVDEGRITKAQEKRFAKQGVRVIPYMAPEGPFNYAAKANFSVRQCRTEHVVLLNDDMEVINEDWLGALLEYSQDPEIGVVGGRLLHADRSIQHVGTVVGVNDGTAHIYHSFPGDFIGYNGFTHLIRNYAAMTGACIATRRSVLAQVGGFDESFAVDFNDTDLCLKILECGYRIVYTPFCELYHYESISLVRTAQDQAEKERFTSKWRKYMECDPYYNVNLARDRIDYALRNN